MSHWSDQPCDLWDGSKDRGGYGRQKVNGINLPVHRLAWEAVNGPVPDGRVLDHLCRNRACLNPTHLEPVTGRENTLRGIGPTALNALKTHCKRGHPLSGKNLQKLPGGRRGCASCKRTAANARYAKRKLESRAS